ncbi:TIGR02147 family protein [Fibrobacter sp. UWB4]|uniref:TIGR02147 family protein n=1 Tax=Fibrobacter sp. UWB4 TaxID=1964356 RepID=UPI000B525BCA|nr:TIGR02147 family protein [Fibrobacter sp. UWB4]OWV17278.1 TIGR02147 family protein [Fibrobacter sp. UWB4]
MKPITEYQNYREYMRDFYEERKRSSLFSWREFSKLAGFASPNFMQLVCEGKSRLSKTGVEKVADAMGLAGADRDYFFAMERFGDARSDSMKLQAFNEMQKIAKENRLRVVDAEAFKYFESWVNPVLRELAPIMPGAKPLELARQCIPVVSAAEVRHSLDFMCHAEFLKKIGEDTYVQTEKVVTGSSEAIPLALRSMNRQMSKFATEAIDEVPPEKRHITGVTFGISEETYQWLVQKLETLRQQVVAMAAKEKEYDKVYRLNLQLFPLTKGREA